MLSSHAAKLGFDAPGDDLLLERTDMATRLLAAAKKGAVSAKREIEEQLLTQLSELQPSTGSLHGLQEIEELTHLVHRLGEGQALLRAAYSVCLGRFCLQALSMLSAVEDSWAVVLAALRLVEGVLLICVGEQADDTDLLLQVLQPLLRRNYLPRNAVARIESAVMSMLGPQMRNLYAPERPLFGPQEYGEAESCLWKLVTSLSGSPEIDGRRRKVLAVFDKVVFECFGVHCEEFGSGINGFQMKTSDVDLSVSLPPEAREKMLHGHCVAEEEEGGASAASKKRKREAAMVAVRVLADKLEKSGITVVEVVANARVPIVKCRYAVRGEEKLVGREEEHEFDVDVSFCNEVALHNSQLLRSYAKFDIRAHALGVLVKHWAKQRGIRSALDGTLSSYAYTLMVIHFLQRSQILPNIQNPPEELKKKLGVESTESLLEDGHNVWFLNPAEYEKVARDPELWLGSKRSMEKLSDLLFGFFRYFALEFNMYSEVVSIRLNGKLRKLQYFGCEFGGTGRKEQEQLLEEEVSTANVAGNSRPAGSTSDVPLLADEPPRSYVSFPVAAGGSDSDEEVVLCKAYRQTSKSTTTTAAESDFLSHLDGDPASEPTMDNSDIGANSFARLAPLPEVLVGRLMKFNKEKGFGFISCPATHARFSRDVFLHQKQFWEAQALPESVAIGDLVLFSLSVSHKGRPQARNLSKAPPDARETLPAVVRPEEGHEVEDACGGQRPPGFSTLSPETSRLINRRQCLCIDDPMEKYRTLGTTLSGQDELSRELRRAVSILKRGADFSYNVKSLMEKPDRAVPARVRERRREYSPIPLRIDDTCEVELQRNIRWDLLKRLPEHVLLEIQQRTGVVVIKIVSEQDHQTHESWSVLIRGSLSSVSKALNLVEQHMGAAKKSVTKENRHAEMLSKAQSFKAPPTPPTPPVVEDANGRKQLEADRATLGRNGAQLSQMFLPASSSARLQSFGPQSNTLHHGQSIGMDYVRQPNKTGSATLALANSVAAKLMSGAAERTAGVPAAGGGIDAGAAGGSSGSSAALAVVGVSNGSLGLHAGPGASLGGSASSLANVLPTSAAAPRGQHSSFVPGARADAGEWSNVALGGGLVQLWGQQPSEAVERRWGV